MAIIPETYDLAIPARDSLLVSLTEMISHAMTNPEPITAADLAAQLLEAVEENIDTVDLVYRG